MPELSWIKLPTTEFLERLYAFNRIKYLLSDKSHCFEEHDINHLEHKPIKIEDYDYILEDELEEYNDLKNQCQKEAVQLAVKFNFATDLTSMAVAKDSSENQITIKDLPEFPIIDNEAYDYINVKVRPIYHYPYHSCCPPSVPDPNLYYYYYETDRLLESEPVTAKSNEPCKIILYSRSYFRGKTVELF